LLGDRFDPVGRESARPLPPARGVRRTKVAHGPPITTNS
jgi:hypothetical protein